MCERQAEATPDTFNMVTDTISMCQTGFLFLIRANCLYVSLVRKAKRKCWNLFASPVSSSSLLIQSSFRALLLGCLHSASFPLLWNSVCVSSAQPSEVISHFFFLLLGFSQQDKLEEFLLNEKCTVFSQMMDLLFGGENRLLILPTMCLNVACWRKGRAGERSRHKSTVFISLELIQLRVSRHTLYVYYNYIAISLYYTIIQLIIL